MSSAARVSASRATRAQAVADLRLQPTFVGLFLAGIALPLDNLGVMGYPISTASALLIFLATILNRPSGTHRLVPAWIMATALAVPLWLVVSAWQNDQWVWSRLGTAAAWAGLIFVVATGRAHAPSLARGALTGLVVAVLGFYLGLAPRTYEWRLTGWISDPNGVAMTLLSLGLASMVWATRRPQAQMWILVFLSAMVLATLSRTGIFALALALAWMLVLRKQNLIGAVLAAALAAYVFENIPDRIKYWGPFAEREGSDALRERILAAETELVSTNQWAGHGPGTAIVEVGDGVRLFFHSSYLSARVEGGWILLGLILVVIIAAFFLLARSSKTPDVAWLQAAIIGLLVTATNIGEALLTPSAALTVGLAVSWWGVRLGQDSEGRRPEICPANVT